MNNNKKRYGSVRSVVSNTPSSSQLRSARKYSRSISNFRAT